MRILVACTSRGIPLYGPSGASAHLRGMARGFLALGHEVRVATARAEDERGRWDLELPVETVHAPPLPWPRGLRTFGARVDGWRLAAAVPGWRCDLVWERHDPDSDAFARTARRLRVPRWVELNAPLSLERAWPAPPDPRALDRELRALRSADRVVAVSAWLARWAEDHGCERVALVANGVEPQGPGDRSATRARLGLEGPVLGFVGTMKRWHGADRIPAILDRLGPDWTALVVGDGPCPPDPHPRLLRTGQVQPAALPDLVAAMDVGLAPYPTGAPPWFCPLKVRAYEAQGVPVVERVEGDHPEAWAAAAQAALGAARVPVIRSWTDVAREVLSERAGRGTDEGLTRGRA